LSPNLGWQILAGKSWLANLGWQTLAGRQIKQKTLPKFWQGLGRMGYSKIV